MLKKQTPWLNFVKFSASDGTKNPIPEDEVANSWNTSRNAQYADFFEWVFDDGTPWKWGCDAESDAVWHFEENLVDGGEWSYIHHANEKDGTRTGTVKKLATDETFNVTLKFAQRFREPGQVQLMSGGERGCAHSHLRLWKIAAQRLLPTLVLEDDVQMVFERSNGEGKSNGKIFSSRLDEILKHAPGDFDVIYLGWSGWRGGFNRHRKPDPNENEVCKLLFRKAEYVWTTVAYVISPEGAKKLLKAARPMNQPVDNFMAWEASQGRLNSYVALDEGDNDGTWAGGIVDQYDFQGDSDIKKSDGGVQGDDAKEFAVGAV